MKRHVLAWWSLTLVLAAVAQAQRTVDQTIPASPRVEVEIEIVSGSLRIMGWDREEVQIKGEIGEDVEELYVEGSGARISIEVDIPDGRGFGRRDIDAHLEVRVPAGARLDIETVSSGIEVEGLAGSADLATVSGNIEVSGSPEMVEAESVSGSIEVEGAKSAIVAESVSGEVRVEGSADRIEVSSVSGSIEVRTGTLSRGDVESVSGTVMFEGALAANARLDVSSHSGSVRLYLPADVSASFDLSTFSGNIESDFGGTARRDSRYTPGKTMSFVAGSGSAEVSVESFSGNVSIRRR